MTTTAVKAPKLSNMVPRKKSTREQKIEAVRYIKVMCEQGIPVVEAMILRTWGTGAVVYKLLQMKVIRKVKGEGYFDWITKDAPETVVDKYWRAHGTVPNRPPAPEKLMQYVKRAVPIVTESGSVTSSPIDEEVKEKFQAHYMHIPAGATLPPDPDENLIAKYGGNTNAMPTMPVELFLDNCIQDCVQYKIIEKGPYIAEKLRRAGYL